MADQEVMTVLPKELRLGAPPTMPQARSYLFRQQSTLSAYNPEDQIQINVPRLQRSYLSKDSYLQFRLNGQFQPTNDTTTYDQFNTQLLLDDSGAWGLFERLEVFDYLGSTILETIDGVPQLMSLLIDMGAEFTDPNTSGQISHGLSRPYITTQSADNTVTDIYSTFTGNFTGSTSGGIAQTATFAPNATNNVLTFTTEGGTWTKTVTFVAGNTYTADAAAAFIVAAFGTGKDVPITVTVEDTPATADKCRIVFYAPIKFTLSGNAVGASPAIVPTAQAIALKIYRETTAIGTGGVGVPFYCGGLQLTREPYTQIPLKQDFSVQFSIPLPSFLGFLSKKMVPLHNGFTIVLTLATKYKPLFQAPFSIPYLAARIETGDGVPPDEQIVWEVTNPGEAALNQPNYSPNNIPLPTVFWWNITDVALICQILELGPVAESMLLSSTQGEPLIVHTKQMRYYRGNSAKNQTEFSLPLNLNVASLTDILWFMRPNGTEDNLNFQSCGTRYKNFLQRWEFQYGSTVLPQSNGIQCMFMSDPTATTGNTWSGSATWSIANGTTECYTELFKARPNDPSRGRMYREQWTNIAVSGFGTWVNGPVGPYRPQSGIWGDPIFSQPKFACGLNTCLVSKKDDLICGLNTNGMNTNIRGYFHPSVPTTNAQKLDVVIDAYAEYDAFINISPGIATTVSF